ncbi:MAG: class I SAM-dependent methyltransferase [Acidobacteria bacterium]|nr:class I SAM-dependent methyltransferase [Acidobacteriota bacterium]MBI3658575.1 class I SAM-dependent methyltransferase [Acidobacteriota bacterium]
MPLGNLLNWLGSSAVFSNILRRLVENNFSAQKRLIREHLLTAPGLCAGDAKILDMGCGTGELSHLIPAKSYIGMDFFWQHLRHAARRYPDRGFTQVDGRAMAFPSARFDAILVVGVLHHMDESTVDATMTEIQRVIKPGGRVLVLEDIPTRAWWNLPGRLIHAADLGAHIRPPAVYSTWIERYFKIDLQFPVLSGFCDYQVFVLTRKLF